MSEMEDNSLIETGGRSGNPSPHKARIAKKERAKPKDLTATADIVWSALQRCEELLEDEDKTTSLKAAHAVFQGATAYAKLYEVSELEARLEALEQAQTIKDKAA